MVPEIFADKSLGQPLAFQIFRVNAYDQHLFVVRAIEDADAPALRQRLGDAPQEIVIELLMARRLEGMHLAALRIDAGHHVLDGAVLARCIHRLEDCQHRPAILRVELLLQRGEALHSVCEHRLGFGLFEVETTGVGRVVIGEPELVRLVDTETAERLGERHDGEFTPRATVWQGLAQAAFEKGRDKRRHRWPQIAQRSHDVNVRELRLPVT